jgi:ribokinase
MKVVVVGSISNEMMFTTPVLPLPGQTVFGTSFAMSPGGRGANQAVAAIRAGAEVHFAGRAGKDMFGDLMVGSLQQKGIDTTNIIRDDMLGTGVSAVIADEKGERTITVSPGANLNLSAADLQDMRFELASADVLLLQLEIPADTVRSSGARVILNPSPALPVSDEILRSVSVLTPDASEAEILTGITITDERSAELAGRILLERGLDRVIITLRSKGALVIDNGGAEHVPGFYTGNNGNPAMNDAFNGALAVALAEGSNFYKAVLFANAAAAVYAETSDFPFRKEILSFMKKGKNTH